MITDRITVTGNTFPHRDQLRAWGGLFNGHERNWTFKNNITDARLAAIRALPGVTVHDNRPQAPDRVQLGDDPRHYNRFSQTDPQVYFGFSSLHRMLTYLEQTPIIMQPDEDRREYGSRNISEAIALAREGWHEGAELAALVSEHMQTAEPPQKRRKRTVAGGSVNVGRMLSGNPQHMTARVRQPGKKVITIYVDVSCSFMVRADSMAHKAAAVAAMCDTMERSGFSCEIVAVDCTRDERLKPRVHIAVTVKQAGQMMNLSDVVFALGHPSFLRRLCFGLIWTRREIIDLHSIYGYVTEAFDERRHPPARGEIYIPPLPLDVCEETYRFDSVERALTILSMLEILGVEKSDD